MWAAPETQPGGWGSSSALVTESLRKCRAPPRTKQGGHWARVTFVGVRIAQAPHRSTRVSAAADDAAEGKGRGCSREDPASEEAGRRNESGGGAVVSVLDACVVKLPSHNEPATPKSVR